VTIFAIDMQHCYGSMVSTSSRREYVSDNDDPTRPKSGYTTPAEGGMINVE